MEVNEIGRNAFLDEGQRHAGLEAFAAFLGGLQVADLEIIDVFIPDGDLGHDLIAADNLAAADQKAFGDRPVGDRAELAAANRILVHPAVNLDRRRP